jgi:hypothetical protein
MFAETTPKTPFATGSSWPAEAVRAQLLATSKRPVAVFRVDDLAARMLSFNRPSELLGRMAWRKLVCSGDVDAMTKPPANASLGDRDGVPLQGELQYACTELCRLSFCVRASARVSTRTPSNFYGAQIDASNVCHRRVGFTVTPAA